MMSIRRRWLMMAAGIAALATTLAVPLLGRTPSATPKGTEVLHLFFTPDAPPRREAVERLKRLLAGRRDVAAGLVLLVRDFSTLRQDPGEDFQGAVKALREMVGPEFGLFLYDEEGLGRAKRFRLTRLPAFVLERGDHIHVVYGTDADLEELFRCEK